MSYLQRKYARHAEMIREWNSLADALVDTYRPGGSVDEGTRIEQQMRVLHGRIQANDGGQVPQLYFRACACGASLLARHRGATQCWPCERLEEWRNQACR